MKKFITYLLSVAIIISLSVLATVAYLQDVDSDVNVMTLGNVDIRQLEYERTVDSNGDFEKISVDTENRYVYNTYKLQEFTQDKPFYPAVYNSNEFNDGDYDATKQMWTLIGSQGSSWLYPKEVKNVLDKFVFVENTGISNAYVRTIFAFEQGTYSKDQLFNNIIKINRNEEHWTWTKEKDIIQNVKIGNGNYYIITATYKGAIGQDGVHSNGVLNPGGITFPSLLQVMMYNTVDNEDLISFGEDYKIYTVSQAVQTNGFDNATEALNTAFGKITESNHPWANQTNP